MLHRVVPRRAVLRSPDSPDRRGRIGEEIGEEKPLGAPSPIPRPTLSRAGGIGEAARGPALLRLRGRLAHLRRK